MLVTALVRGVVAVASVLNAPPVFGMFDIPLSGLPLLPDRWASAPLLLDWGLTAVGVLASIVVIAQLTERPARPRAAHVLAWMMAVDAVIYLASFAVIWPFYAPPASWNALDWWGAAGILVGTLCTFWTAVIVLRRTAHHREL
jgi:hypothetical protein